LLIRSLDFATIEALQVNGDWDAAGAILNHEARALERGGADMIILSTNTMHKLASQDDGWSGHPIHSYSGCDGAAIKAQGLQRPGLMATAFRWNSRFRPIS